jgi:hypothetical protein
MTTADVARALKEIETGPIEEWPPTAGDTVLAGLRSGDPEVMLVAARLAWPVMTEPVAEELLRVVASDAGDDVRGTAIIAFGPVLEDACIDAMEGFDDEAEKANAEALSSRLTPAQLRTIGEALRRTYEDDAQPKVVRRRALEASVRCPQPWHEQAIRSAWAVDDEDWKVTAMFCMGFVGGFEDVILAALNETTGDVRLQAVQAAGMAQLVAAGPLVMQLAASEDTEEELRLEAIYAMGSIRPDGADDLLHALADSDDEEVAMAAEEAIDDFFLGWDEDDEEAGEVD